MVIRVATLLRTYDINWRWSLHRKTGREVDVADWDLLKIIEDSIPLDLPT